MLTAEIDINDFAERCTFAFDKLVFGASEIRKFSSSLLRMDFLETVDSISCWVGEAESPVALHDTPSLPTVRSFVRHAGVLIFLSRVKGSPRIDIARTDNGSSPLYVTLQSNGILFCSWKFEEVVARSGKEPDIEACRRFLAFGAGPVRQQIFRDVFMLWPGESLEVAQGKLAFAEAHGVEIATPGVVTDTARVSDAFLELTAEVLSLNLTRANNPLLELSGGKDSSCVAIAAASTRESLSSYGAILPGAVGEQQRRRRQELVGLLGLHDYSAPADRPGLGPFSSLKFEECTLTPYDDAYRMSCVSVVDEHPAGEFDLIITGIGGDELTAENTFYRSMDEVAGRVCGSAIDAAVGRADMFMRRGIWVCQPFIDQRIVEFCRRLPAPLRQGRILNILAMARAGLSDGYIFPRMAEHFGTFFRREALLLDFDDLFHDSVLHELGVINLSESLDEVRQPPPAEKTSKMLVRLWAMRKLDLILKRHILG